MIKRPSYLGLRHLALNVMQLEKCRDFYCDLLGMQIVWQPDPDNIYLSSGTDNLALHRAKHAFQENAMQHLDHLGFFLSTPDDVDEWHTYLAHRGVTILAPPKDHRDGTRSFYCSDPDGNTVQMIHYPMS
jgi:catechol 2,3-dioxygenase-like lactoylglutathione lyase family enzyme